MPLTAQNILETIRDNATQMYQTRIPNATQTSIAEVGKAITADEITMNEFVTILNKIAHTDIVRQNFKNPLARLKNTGVPMGSHIEEIFINPATDLGYDSDGTKLLKTETPDGKSCYYGLNRRGSYAKSINEVKLQQAFTSEQNFMSFYNEIIASLSNGDEIDEFILCKNVIGKAIDNGAMLISESDIANPKQLAKDISTHSKMFSFPSTQYCGYNKVNATKISSGETACTTFCRPDRQALIIRADVQTDIDYEVLATMFNMEVAKLEAMTILVDEIPSTTHDIYAVLCDIDAIQIRDNVFKTTSHFNGGNLEWKFYLHHWQFLYLSMFGNAVAFGKAKAV